MAWVRYRTNEDVWAVVLFDVPTTTSAAKRDYARLRRSLLEMGMTMLQFSVYVCYLPSGKSAKPLMDVVQEAQPRDGRVTAMIVSDAEYADAYRFVGDGYGENSPPDPSKPEQLTIF